ncbi:SprT-like domain-containing protein [Yersinia sp. 22-579]|uniref:SprT-like domain-containing protein n=1 Tax=Yersinia sp. 22-579 TaxID=3057580 RepID=UPI00263A6336|nr:SprT-like domain-containing protein [Yersinia sp. 22-579]EKN6178935.1 sprT domain-containing protein [Yersinia enterocolitica]
MSNKLTEEAYVELQTAYNYYNQHLFDNQLAQCLITFQRNSKTMGYFSCQRFVSPKNGAMIKDEIAIKPEYLPSYPLVEVMQTLVHEMCHMWQYHYGTPSRRTYHNVEWAGKMESIGLMPSSTGTVGGAKTGQKIAGYPIPNGLFQRYTLELFKSGFVSSWYARFPAEVAPVYTFSAAIEEWRDTLAQTNQCANEAESEVEVTESLLSMALVAPVSTFGAVNLAITRSAKAKTRHKWMCPECGDSFMGKSSLNMICGNCYVKVVDLDVE